jgi:hypothetical protein
MAPSPALEAYKSGKNNLKELFYKKLLRIRRKPHR